MEHPLLALRSDHLPTTIRVVSFEGRECLARPYRFEVFALVPNAEGDLDPGELIGRSAALEIRDERDTPRRTYHGVVSSLEFVREYDEDLLYRVELVPRLWMLSLSQHSRVFVGDTVRGIVEKVLREAGLHAGEHFSFAFSPTHTHEVVTQYRESDLDFVHRLLEREGCYYYFEQREAGEVAVFVNAKDQQPDCTPAAVRYFATGESDTSAVDALREFRMRAVAAPSGVRVRDYDPLQPDLGLNASVSHIGGVGGALDSHGDNFTTSFDGRRIATQRREEIQTGERRFYGVGRVFNLAVGHRFALEDHSRLGGRYTVVELHHRGTNEVKSDSLRARLGLDPDRSYRVEVVAILGEQQFRPPRVTPTPRINGVEEAVVWGPLDSPYAQIDAHGRYQVQLLFDEGVERAPRAPMWVRMLQPHGGNPEGQHLPLRKGTEVLVVFLGGDADRPVIAGVAHNLNTPSVVTSRNATQNVIHTGGDNRVEMEDLAGAQHVTVSTPTQSAYLHLGATLVGRSHNFVVSTTGTGLLNTGGNHDVTVGGAMSERVTGPLSEHYRSTMTTKVAGAVSETYQTSLRTVVNGKKYTRVDGPHIEEVGGNLDQTIDGGLEQTIRNGADTTIHGTSSTTVFGNTQIKNNGKVTQTITGGASINSPLGYSINAPTKWFKVTAYSGEATGIKIGALGLKAETVGVVLGANVFKAEANVLKIDVNAVKIDRYLAKYDNGKLTKSDHLTKLENGIIELKKKILTVIS